MAISNKELMRAISKANKYIETLRQQNLTTTMAAQKINEAVNRVAVGSKPRTFFPTVRPKNGKISAKQRQKLLKSYAEIQKHKDFFKPLSDVRQRRQYKDDEQTHKIRQILSDKYKANRAVFTDSFFDFISSDAFQKAYDVFGSEVVQETINQISHDMTILDDIGQLQAHLNAYMNNPHRDEYYIEEFQEIFEYFRY